MEKLLVDVPPWVMTGLPWAIAALAFGAAIAVWRAFSEKAAAIKIGLAAIMALAGGAISAGSSGASMWELTETASPMIQFVMTMAFGLLPAFALVAKLNRRIMLCVLLAGLSIVSSYASFYAMLETAASAATTRKTDNASLTQERAAAQAELDAAIEAQGAFAMAAEAAERSHKAAAENHESLRIQRDNGGLSVALSDRDAEMTTTIADKRAEASRMRAAADCELQGPRGCKGYAGQPVTAIGRGPGYDAAKSRYEVLVAEIRPLEAERARLRQQMGTAQARLLSDLDAAAEKMESTQAALQKASSELGAAAERVTEARKAVKAARVNAAPGQAEKVWTAIGAALSLGGETQDYGAFVFWGSIVLALTFDLINLSFGKAAAEEEEATEFLGVWREVRIIIARETQGPRYAQLLREKIRKDQEAVFDLTPANDDAKQEPVVSEEPKALPAETGEEEFFIDGLRVPTLAEIASGKPAKFQWSSKTAHLNKKLAKCKTAAQRERVLAWRDWRMGKAKLDGNEKAATGAPATANSKTSLNMGRSPTRQFNDVRPTIRGAERGARA